ncbi:tol-pal system YbgF family protein [Litoribrevibacter euphylliae]|uniref:Tol-pal system YbgF family protein n=1 Tax=Litoribrevibacter euphylliae TaxID=1834034 RepID=A0ABV7HA64_9GAMM
MMRKVPLFKKAASLLGIGLIAVSLQACFPGPGTGLTVAGLGGHKFAMNKENIELRAHAALHEESDLLTYSVEAISKDKTDEAVLTYLEGYNNPENSDPIRAIALYQIGLVYMNHYNRGRDDNKAAEYLVKARDEFNIDPLNQRIETRLAKLEKRKDNVVILTADQHLMNWKKQPKLPPKNIPHDEEMKDFTARAITTDRIQEAILLYTLMYENKGSTDQIRASSLFQIGLMYMSPYNAKGDQEKALEYFIRIQREFPNSEVAKRANLKAGYLINKQKIVLD